MRTRVSLSTLAIALALAACSANASPGGTGRMQVVTTTTILADLVANVGGDRVEVAAMVPPGGEVHTFDPSPSDVTRLSAAGLVFSNGLGLDEWLEDLVADTGTDAPLVALAEDMDGVTYREGDDADHGGVDPHLWQNVAYAANYVERIRDELSERDPDGAAAYAANADAYLAELRTLDEEVRAAFDAIPAAHRRLVSYHDAFGYLADAYSLEIVGTVTGAPGQDPSAGEVAALIDEIRRLGVRAILTEAEFPPDLADRIGEETGIEVIGDLQADSLGPAPADTYIGLMRANAQRIAEALR